ncbi:MAG: 3'-5' exonuclease [Proteobacteria bacterium]|nr:3'-5' exonuclease [Pseudomonadota bacterium]MBS0493639.1 3'-5' exonuclease [Pseudomonadota bacterium]
MPSPIAVIDFETTGMTPAQGSRATEVGIVLIEGERVVDRFQSLMQTGVWIPPFITQLTGISNGMLADAPPAAEVMRAAARFVGDAPMVAHNAAFDSKFWQAELQHAGLAAPQPFACTVLLSRRVYPDAPSHSLGNLTAHLGLPSPGRAHRALADAEMAANLLIAMQRALCQRFELPWPEHGLLMRLQRSSRQSMDKLLRQHRLPEIGAAAR